MTLRLGDGTLIEAREQKAIADALTKISESPSWVMRFTPDGQSLVTAQAHPLIDLHFSESGQPTGLVTT